MVTANFDTKALIKTLQTLPTRIQKNVVVGGIRAGANTIKDEARRLAPLDTGNLKKSIATIKRNSDKNTIQFSVTPSRGGRNDGWYAHFLEFGTSKMSAKPFLRPAFESKQDEVLQTTKEYIANRLPNEVAKAKK